MSINQGNGIKESTQFAQHFSLWWNKQTKSLKQKKKENLCVANISLKKTQNQSTPRPETYNTCNLCFLSL